MRRTNAFRKTDAKRQGEILRDGNLFSRTEPPTSCLQRRAPPETGRPVELHGTAERAQPRLLADEKSVQNHRLGSGQKAAAFVVEAPARLHECERRIRT